jgi:hypothetical protein
MYVSLDCKGYGVTGHTDTTVVWALRPRETALRPTIGATIGIKKGVFLLETEPRNGILG